MKTYLGDSVYCETDRGGLIVLTTENGYGPPSNTIHMDDPEVMALIRFLERNFKLKITVEKLDEMDDGNSGHRAPQHQVSEGLADQTDYFNL